MSLFPNKTIFKFFPLSFILYILIVFFIIILFNYNKIKHYSEIRQERDKQKEIVTDLETRVKDKKTDKEKLLTDKFRNEQIARDQLKMKKNNEKVMIPSGEDEETSPTEKIK